MSIKKHISVPPLLVATLALALRVEAHDHSHAAHEQARGPVIPHLSVLASNLPPAAKGITDLKFSEFFASPVGPRGLEFTKKLKELDGQKVRILGYMVRQMDPWTNAFLLAPLPIQLHECEYAQSDDLPATTLYVRMPGRQSEPVPFTPGPMLLTGTLHVGPVGIENERRSWVQLDLDPAPPARKTGASSFRQQPPVATARPAL